MGKSRSGKSAGAGKRRGLSILFGAGCMAVILGAAVSAEPDDEYRMPELICPQPDGTGGWYQTGPDIKIIHTDPDGVTRYKVETSSGKLLEGELRLEKKEKECADEKQEKESGSCPRETGKGEEPGTLPAGKKKENVMPSEQEEDAEEQSGWRHPAAGKRYAGWKRYFFWIRRIRGRSSFPIHLVRMIPDCISGRGLRSRWTVKIRAQVSARSSVSWRTGQRKDWKADMPV